MTMIRELDPPLDSGESAAELCSLSEYPELYPGEPEKSSYLYHRGRVWQISIERGQRITKARVAWHDSAGRPRQSSLPNLLLRLGATRITDRIPVLAIGSNSYPRQIHDKLHNTATEDTIPVLQGTLTGAEIVFCPYLAERGYLPVTLRKEVGAKSIASLQLLSNAQLTQIGETERNYWFISLKGLEGITFTIDGSQESLSEFYGYWHPRWLGYVGELPPICAGTVAASSYPSAEIARIKSERDLLVELGAEFSQPNLQSLYQHSESDLPLNKFTDRESVLTFLADKSIDNQPGVPIIQEADVSKYGEIYSEFGHDLPRNGFVVRPTPVSRTGAALREPIAFVDKDTISERNLGSRGVAYHVHEGGTTALPVKIKELAPGTQDDGIKRICLDQMMRDGLGVAIGEHCDIAPLRLSFTQKLRYIVGKPFSTRWFAGRAVSSATPIMERPLCWLDQSLMDAVGVEPGGSVVLMSVENDSSSSVTARCSN